MLNSLTPCYFKRILEGKKAKVLLFQGSPLYLLEVWEISPGYNRKP